MLGLLASLMIALEGPALEPQSLCDRVQQIKSIPMKGRGSDEVYVGLLESGDSVIPCLIEKITDKTPMPDPRQAPTYDGVVVGDVAFWILVEIARVDFTAMLPEDVAERFKERGVYAYFEYVALPFNRAELQQRWRSWWRTSSKR